MRKSRCSEQQIALALQQVDHGATVGEVCRKLGISEQTFYRWKKKFGGMAGREAPIATRAERRTRLPYGCACVCSLQIGALWLPTADDPPAA